MNWAFLILAENVGGSLARTMIMDVKERLVIIKMPGLAEKYYKILEMNVENVII